MKYLFYIFIPMPFVFSGLWIMSIFAFGLGIIAPFIIALEHGYALLTALLFTIIYHLFMVMLLHLSIFMIEKFKLSIEAMLINATLQLIIFAAYFSEIPLND